MDVTIVSAFVTDPTTIITSNNNSSYLPPEILTDEILAEYLGPTRDSLAVVIPVTVIYVIIFITGIVGNISTCIVIDRNKSMHTATNFYLFSLAISDLLLLVSGLPQEVWSIWSRYPYVFGNAFCKLRGLFSETSANATVLTITAFTIERYVAICHPFLSHTIAKLSRVVKLIVGIWCVAICFAVPQALQFGIQAMIEGQRKTDMCHVVDPIIEHSFEVSTFLFFVTPMVLISVLYALIALQLRNSTMMKRRNGVGRGTMVNGSGVMGTAAAGSRKLSSKQHGQSSRRVLKMLVAVVVAFFICWAPFHAQRLLAIYAFQDDHDHDRLSKIYDVLTYISGVLYYVSATINPLLYNIMSNKFREAFKDTFTRCCCCRLAAGDGTDTANPGCRSTYGPHQRSYSVLSRGGGGGGGGTPGGHHHHHHGTTGGGGGRGTGGARGHRLHPDDSVTDSVTEHGGRGSLATGDTTACGTRKCSLESTVSAHHHQLLGGGSSSSSSATGGYQQQQQLQQQSQQNGHLARKWLDEHHHHHPATTTTTHHHTSPILLLNHPAISNDYDEDDSSLQLTSTTTTNSTTTTTWPRDRSTISLQLVQPPANLDTIPPHMKLVAVHVVHNTNKKKKAAKAKQHNNNNRRRSRLAALMAYLQRSLTPGGGERNRYGQHSESSSSSVVVVDKMSHNSSALLTKAMSDISNSSLRDVDRAALEDELSAYMHEVQLRECGVAAMS